jgi:putative ABC transport system permease protein
MRPGITHTVFRSITYYRKVIIYQIIIIALLSAVITGSLLTGFSVRQSLLHSSSEKLGNTQFLISSGLRYFSPGLTERIKNTADLRCTSLLETSGFCQNLLTGKRELKVNINGIRQDFFSFHGIENILLKPGEVAINSVLANNLKISIGDEIILSHKPITDISPDSPFAQKTENSSAVFKVGKILTPGECSDFSLSISQVTPANVFILLNDLISGDEEEAKVNRILLGSSANSSFEKIYKYLKGKLLPEDIGLSVRMVLRTGETEIISSRIFIDREILGEIRKVLPSSQPVLTYLVNSISLGLRSTPYSFVAAINPSENNYLQSGSNIIINRWLAEDINAALNDSIVVTWYAPGKMNDLEEQSAKFKITRIVSQTGLFSDSLLMPEFPGIAGRTSCTDWDAGVKIKMDKIRKKDENYWNDWRGTPKAFISYEKGSELWANNFGPATAIRFSPDLKVQDLVAAMAGKLDPDKCGYTVLDMKAEMSDAAKESVDFSTLFISLGFFIILSCIMLLLLTVSSFFDSRKRQVNTLFALGFNNKMIGKILLYETGITAVTGSAAGALLGTLVNRVIIFMLNSVWIGAVQTDTLEAFSGLAPVFSGFIITAILIFVFTFILIKRYAGKLGKAEDTVSSGRSARLNLILLGLVSVISVSLLAVLLLSDISSSPISFSAGASLFVAGILLWRQYVIRGLSLGRMKRITGATVSGRFFSFYPSQAVAPVLFIAAGLFALIITGINRLEIKEKNLGTSGGTGGYLLWAESAIPVKENLTSPAGRKSFGLDESPADGLSFIQLKRSQGDDASCLNLSHISVPTLLGVDTEPFVKRNAFSFSTLIPEAAKGSPWDILSKEVSGNIIYGFADQTVLQWGLKKKAGDTLKMRSESGQLLNVVIAGGLNSSIFQGYLLIGKENFERHLPSVYGSSVFLIDGNRKLIDKYMKLLNTRFENSGITVIPASERLASFFRVTNTYLSVFTIMGGFGMILGVIGLGFVLGRNYNFRKREFALMMASGFTASKIKNMVIKEQILILMAGLLTGIISSVVATLPSIRNGSDIPWISLVIIVGAIILSGLTALFVSVRSIRQESLISSLRRE